MSGRYLHVDQGEDLGLKVSGQLPHSVPKSWVRDGFPSSPYEADVTLISTPRKNGTKQDNHRPVSL